MRKANRVRSILGNTNCDKKIIMFSVMFMLLMSMVIPTGQVSGAIITVNNDIGILKVIDINASNISEVPDTWFIGELVGSEMVETYNYSIEYNSSETALEWAVGPNPFYGPGRLFIGGLYPSPNTTYHFKMQYISTNGYSVDIRGGNFWIKVSWTEPTRVSIYSYYYNSTGDLKNNFMNYYYPGGAGGNKVFDLNISYDAITGYTYTTIGSTSLYTRYLNQVPYEHPLISPSILSFYMETIPDDFISKIFFYNFEQIYERKYITPIGAPISWQPFGIDGPVKAYTMEGMQYLVDHGYNATIYWDYYYWGVELNETTKIFYTDLLNNKSFEMGLHTFLSLTDKPLDEALIMLDNEIRYATENFSCPLSYTAAGGGHNRTHTNYVWNTYNVYDRSNPTEIKIQNNIGQLQNETWAFWNRAIENNTSIGVFGHELDKEPAIGGSIDRSKFIQWVDTIYNNSRIIVPEAYWHDVSLQANNTEISELDMSLSVYKFRVTTNNNVPVNIDVYDENGIYSPNINIIGSDGFVVDYTFNTTTNSFRFLARNNILYEIKSTVTGPMKYRLERTPGFAMNVSIPMPSNWVNSTVQVYDNTTGTLVAWIEGSIEFTADARHEYILSEIVPSFNYTVSGRSVSFTDTSPAYNITAWYWEFGDSSSSTNQNPDHTYDEDGTFIVTLTITDEEGGRNWTSEEVTVDITTDAERIDLLIPIVIAATGLIVVLGVFSNGLVRPFGRMFRRFPS